MLSRKYTKIQLPQKHYFENLKITNHRYRFWMLKIVVSLVTWSNHWATIKQMWAPKTLKLQATLRARAWSYLLIKKITLFTGKHLCWNLFFNKDARFQSCISIKKRFQHRCFLVKIATFLRRPGLRNICEQLFERFLTWTNSITSNAGIEGNIFSKRKLKKNSKTPSWKNCLFMMLLIISFFSISPLHVSRHFPYIIKMIVVKGFKTA